MSVEPVSTALVILRSARVAIQPQRFIDLDDCNLREADAAIAVARGTCELVMSPLLCDTEERV